MDALAGKCSVGRPIVKQSKQAGSFDIDFAKEPLHSPAEQQRLLDIFDLARHPAP